MGVSFVVQEEMEIFGWSVSHLVVEDVVREGGVSQFLERIREKIRVVVGCSQVKYLAGTNTDPFPGACQPRDGLWERPSRAE